MASEKIDDSRSNGNGTVTVVEEQKNVESGSEAKNQGGYSEGLIDIPEETTEAFGGDELRARVFFEKYALRGKSGKMVETIPEQMWQRVAKEISSP